jgi:hypothetical protein
MVGVIGLALAWCPAQADPMPQPPCGGAPAVPALAALDEPPSVQVVAAGERAARWPSPTCTGWHGDGYRMLVALAGRFRLAETEDALLARFGAVSRLADTRYWSVSTKRWQKLVTQAQALDGPTGAPRGDFSAAELRSGARYFSETGTFTSGPVTYRIELREATDTRLVIAVENVGVMSRLMINLFDPGELQTLYVIERGSGDVWSYYSLTRTRETASVLTAGHDASYVNRAMALFAHFAGGVADSTPLPVAWWR